MGHLSSGRGCTSARGRSTAPRRPPGRDRCIHGTAFFSGPEQPRRLDDLLVTMDAQLVPRALED
ncbi:MAG: hypothetical protein C4290_06195 [Chloroflexota bacterium]